MWWACFRFSTVLLLTVIAVGARASDFANSLGETSNVPAPWNDVAVAQQSSSLIVSVTDREVRFEPSSPLPTQITSRGIDLLAGPVRLEVDRVGGATQVFDSSILAPQLSTAPSPRAVDIESAGIIDQWQARIDARIEFDGFMRFRIEFPQHTPMDGARVVIPLRLEVAEAYSRWITYDYGTERGDQNDISNATATLGDEVVDLFFVPEVWVGNDEVGLTWAAETNRELQLQCEPERADRSISLVPEADSVNLVFRLADRPSGQFASTSPAIEFALLPTPTKPYDARWGGDRWGVDSSLQSMVARLAQSDQGISGEFRNLMMWNARPDPGDYRPRYVGRPDVWNPQVPPGGQSDEFPQYVTTRQQVESLDIGFVPYTSAFHANLFDPDVLEYEADWTGAGFRLQIKYPFEYQTEVVGDPPIDARPNTSGIRVCPTEDSFRDYFLRNFDQTFSDESVLDDAEGTGGLAGIYMDIGGYPAPHFDNGHRDPQLPADTETTHNHGGLAPDTGKVFFPSFSARETYQRLWTHMKSLDPELRISAHMSKPSRLLGTYLDAVVSGEALNNFFGTREGEHDPDYDDPALSEIMRWDYLDTHGYSNRILPQVIKGTTPPNAEGLSSRLIRHILLTGVGPRFMYGRMPVASLDEINFAWERIATEGFDPGRAVFHPYWSNGDVLVHTRSGETRASLYQERDRAVVAVGNFDDTAHTDSITITLAQPVVRVRDALDEDLTQVSSTATFSAVVPARGYALYLVDLQPDVVRPGAVSDLSVVSDAGAVELDWTAGLDDVAVAGYLIQRRRSPEGYRDIAITTDTRYVDRTVRSGDGSLRYQIRTIDGVGNMSPGASVPVSSVGPDADAPTTPTDLRVEDDRGRIVLEWEASSDRVGVEAYEVSRDGVLVGETRTTRFVDSTVPAFTLVLAYKVRARDGAGNLSPAATVAPSIVKPDLDPPEAPPAAPSVRVDCSERVAFSWLPGSDDVAVASYEVWRNGVLIAEVPGDVLEFADRTVSQGQTYAYEIRSVDAGGNTSGPSPSATVTP